MRSKTIEGCRGHKIRVEGWNHYNYVCVVMSDPSGRAMVIDFSPKKLRRLGEACGQIADEMEKAK